MRADGIKKHEATAGHRLVLSTYADPTAKSPQPVQKTLAQCSLNTTKIGVQEYVPRRAKFMDAIRS